MDSKHVIYDNVTVCVCQQDMLQIVTLELNELSSDISNKNQMLLRIEEEIQHAEEVCEESKT